MRVALRIWKSSCWQMVHTAFGLRRMPAIFFFTLRLTPHTRAYSRSYSSAMSLVRMVLQP